MSSMATPPSKLSGREKAFTSLAAAAQSAVARRPQTATDGRAGASISFLRHLPAREQALKELHVFKSLDNLLVAKCRLNGGFGLPLAAPLRRRSLDQSASAAPSASSVSVRLPSVFEKSPLQCRKRCHRGGGKTCRRIAKEGGGGLRRGSPPSPVLYASDAVLATIS